MITVDHKTRKFFLLLFFFCVVVFIDQIGTFSHTAAAATTAGGGGGDLSSSERKFEVTKSERAMEKKKLAKLVASTPVREAVLALVSCAA